MNPQKLKFTRPCILGTQMYANGHTSIRYELTHIPFL